ncbi:MAG: histidine--tRNA ligase [Myxococcota bacterium]
MRFRVLPGFRDFLPQELAVRRWIESAWRRASRGAGFEEIDGPVLEPLELLSAKSGEEIVGQLYAFEDKGGRKVALRPEMTPTIARMVAGRAGGLPKPIKWYCIPEFYRYEKPQRGRARAFYQWNADIFGSDDPAADAELVAVAVEALRQLGLGAADVVVRINDRRLLRRQLASIDVGEEDEGEVLALIDKLERDAAAPERLEALLGQTRAREVSEWCERMPLENADELAAVIEACADFGIEDFVQPNFRIVRGLAYYTGSVWEIFDRAGELRSVAGGGRYDELIELFGGPKLPALGFGMGDLVLTELLRKRGLVPDAVPRVDVVVVPIGADMRRVARRVVAKLRSQGVRVDTPYAAPRVARALKAAEASGAARVVLVGPDEWQEGSVKVKDMASGRETVVRFDDLS